MGTRSVDALMASGLIKRSVRLSGHLTSLAMEREFWDALENIASARGVSVSRLINDIDVEQGQAELAAEEAGELPEARNLTSAVRVFVLREVQSIANAKKF